jgi:hypothetical protein
LEPPSRDQQAAIESWTSGTVTLTGLPDELVEQMRIAIEDGQKDRLDELIAVLANRKTPCARALKDLADNYEYDALTNMLSGARVRSKNGSVANFEAGVLVG